MAVDRSVSPTLKSVNRGRRWGERVPAPTRSPLEGDHREDLRESRSHFRSRSWLRRDRTPRTSLSRLASQSCARGARSTASRAKRIFGRARARARTLATATCCAARGLSRGGRAPYLGEGAARARRDDVNPMVFGVARERLRGGREAAARSRLVSRGAAGQKSGPRGPNAARYVGQDVRHAPCSTFAASTLRRRASNSARLGRPPAAPVSSIQLPRRGPSMSRNESVVKRSRTPEDERRALQCVSQVTSQ